MPLVEAAFLRAAAIHESSARAHDQAAAIFTSLGKTEQAATELHRARCERNGAAIDRTLAQERHEWIISRPETAI